MLEHEVPELAHSRPRPPRLLCHVLVTLPSPAATSAEHQHHFKTPLDRRAAVGPPTRSSLCVLSKEGLKLTPAPFALPPEPCSHHTHTHTHRLPSQSGLSGDRALMDTWLWTESLSPCPNPAQGHSSWQLPHSRSKPAAGFFTTCSVDETRQPAATLGKK